MKQLLTLILLILATAAYFIWSPLKQQPKVKPETPAPSSEEPPLSPALEPVSLTVSPTSLIQGEPALITIEGLDVPSTIQSLTLAGQPLDIFVEDGKIKTLVGIELHKEPGSYPIILTLADGRKIEGRMEIGQRVLATETFDIPAQLGGNTKEAEQALTNTLSQDTTLLNSITEKDSPEKFWDGPFRLPLDGSPVVTDVYGYSRQTGAVNLSHNGTDFRAPEGTPVYAMNAGNIVFAGSFRNYGQTIVIDHGLGVMTLYMHLSEISARLGDQVEKGDLIAKSGNTGYSLGPHLHLSVRIGSFSIDPLKFLGLMGPTEESAR